MKPCAPNTEDALAMTAYGFTRQGSAWFFEDTNEMSFDEAHTLYTHLQVKDAPNV